MTDWIKDNKFVATLLLIAILALAGTFLFSGSKTGSFEASKEAYDAASANYSNLARIEPFPSQESLDERRKAVIAYRKQVEDLQKALLAFRPETFERIRPAEFTTRINEILAALKKDYDAKGIKYPEKWQLGFESYTSGLPRDAATDFLNYELNALNWLYGTLAEAGPSELVNVHRKRLPVEDGREMGEAEPKPGAVKPRNPRNAPKASGPTEPYYSLPVEITFKGRESALRKFLEGLANSEEYFVTVRSMRVQNAKAETPPKRTDAKFEVQEAPAVTDPFGGGAFDFVIPGEESAPEETPAEDGAETPFEEEAPADPVPAPDAGGGGDGQILAQVLGAEEIFVFLQLDFLLFRDNVALPEVKQTAP